MRARPPQPVGQIVSGSPNVAWPVLPTPVAAGMLALQFELERSQWWDAAALTAHQHLQLTEVLRHARHSSPFYEAHLQHLDLTRAITADAFAALPTITRAEVQGQGDALRCRVVPPDHGDLGFNASSGSTGRPIRIQTTGINQLWWRAITLRDHLWHGRDFNATLAVLKTHSGGGSDPVWGEPTHGVFVTGPSVSFNSRHHIAAQAEWLAHQNAAYLLTHATNLRALLHYCRAEKRPIPGLREVRTFGEMLSPDLRDLCREVLHVPLTDAYSAAEIGVIALQCPENDHYHVQSEHVVVEILDEAGRRCEAGQIGRIVITTLHNFATPLVRYELNDYAIVGEPCSCGRGLPVLTQILGRRRNMLRLPDGTTHWPSFPAEVWGWDSPIRQFQLVQKELSCITVRLVVDRPLTTAESNDLFARLNERLGWPFAYTIDYCDHIDTGPGFEDFQCLLDPVI